MPIEFECPCGARYRVKDRNAGRAFQCRACNMSVMVPGADGVDLGIRTDDPPAPVDMIPPGLALDPSAPAPSIVLADRPKSLPRRTAAQRVVVVDFDMPFGSLVRLLIKLGLASIPAMIVVWVIIALLGLLYAAILAAFGGGRL
jgi:hypothetical protein